MGLTLVGGAMAWARCLARSSSEGGRGVREARDRP